MIFLAVVNGQPQGNGPGAGHPALHRSPHRCGAPAYRLPVAKAKDREHILEGYQLALDHLDDVIAIIRGSADRGEARENLVAYFAGKKHRHQRHWQARIEAAIRKSLHAQAGRRHPRIAIAPPDAALDRRNSQRVGEIRERSRNTNPSSAREKKLRGVIVKELEEIKKKYGDERRTQIVRTKPPNCSWKT